MKKAISVFIVFVLTSYLVFSEEEQNPKIPALGNIVYLEGGDFISNLGIGNGIILNGGYEAYVLDNLSAFTEINTWLMKDITIAAGFGINFHPIPRFKIDPFVGFGIMYGRNINRNINGIDIPVDLGVNFLLNDYFGFRVRGKLYLLSLNNMVTEINAGVLLKF